MSWDPVWEYVFSNQEWGKYPPEDLIRFIARTFYVNNRKEIKILEVGCGLGANLWFLAREGFETFGIDGSQTAITRAKNRLNNECPNWRGELTVGDFSILPYPNDYFDAVVDIEAVCCNSYATSKEIYSEMARVARGGGGSFIPGPLRQKPGGWNLVRKLVIMPGLSVKGLYWTRDIRDSRNMMKSKTSWRNSKSNLLK
jgi:SAM-dependent methyltransferase